MLMEIKGVSKVYDKKLSLISLKNETNKVIKEVSMNVEEKEIVGLVGESGCGKSTLSRLIMRLEKPSNGSIFYKGKDIWKYKGKDLKSFRRECQMIFQDTLTSLNPNLKIIDSLIEPLDNHFQISKEEKLKKIVKLISFVNLKENILNKYPREVSGGERQRVNICRSLLLEPKFLVCDEITSSLDVCTQAAILNIIRKLNQVSKAGILFISHDISIVKHICSKIFVMYNGEIIEVIDNMKEKYIIKHPYTKKLIESMPISNPNQRKK